MQAMKISRMICLRDWLVKGGQGCHIILLQENQDGIDWFIGANTHRCNAAEANYSANKGEMSALIMELRRLEHILSYKPFKARIDNAALTWLQNQKEIRGIYSRLLDTLSLFTFRTEQ